MHRYSQRIDCKLNTEAEWRVQDAVTSAGPLLALLGFVVLPFVWSLPEALVTAELATAFPEDSGSVFFPMSLHTRCLESQSPSE